MDENRIEELAKKFFEFIPRQRNLDLDELRKLFRKKIAKISDSELWQIVTFLLSKKFVVCSTHYLRSLETPREISVDDNNITVDGERFSSVFRPTES